MASSIGPHISHWLEMADKKTRVLLQNRVIPEVGWKDLEIERFLSFLALLDTNNFENQIGAGEREGRIASDMVRRLHCSMSHGIGRSGNLLESQPKAEGSSLLGKLANEFASEALHLLGLLAWNAAIVTPLCTGMTISLCISAFKKERPDARYVVWLRADQKSAFKAISFVGCSPIVIEPVIHQERHELITDIRRVRDIFEEKALDIVCLLSTTSCFAPRSPDSLIELSELCARYSIPHLVNNAYGLQSQECLRLLNEGRKGGRIDACVQSLDKNFQVPVGGAIIAGKRSTIQRIASSYPGRASSVPSRDFVITILSLGKSGLKKMYCEQHRIFEIMKAELNEVAFDTPSNKISIAIKLDQIPASKRNLFGGQLFTKGMTGARVVCGSDAATIIDNHKFINWGQHHSTPSEDYLNVACSIGATEEEARKICDIVKKAVC